MRTVRPSHIGIATGALALAFTLGGCGPTHQDAPAPAPAATSETPSATPSASATAPKTARPTQTPTPSATPSAAQRSAPIQAPPAPIEPPAVLTDAQWCATNTPATSGAIQHCAAIAAGDPYLDPVTGAYTGPGDLSDYPDMSDTLDPDDPGTWSGVNPVTGENYAGIPAPPDDY